MGATFRSLGRYRKRATAIAICKGNWDTFASNENDNDKDNEVSIVNQEPGPTDVSAGVLTPHNKTLICLCALLTGQGRVLVLCSRLCTESRVKKDQQAFAVTNSIEFKMTSTHMFQEKMGSLSKAAESTDSSTKGTRSHGRVRQTLSSRWFEFISPFQASIH